MTLQFLKQGLQKDIIRSSLGVLTITLGIKLLGYFEKVILAYYFGTSYEVDVFNVVLTLTFSFFFLFREIIEPGYLNVFIKLKNRGNHDEWSLFNGFFLLLLLISISLVVIILVLPNITVAVFAPGFQGKNLDLVINLLYITFPSTIFLSITTLTNITLNGLKKFIAPAASDLCFKVVIILLLVLFVYQFGIYGMAIGVLVGSIVKFGIQFFALRNHIQIRTKSIRKQDLSEMWLLTWPLLVGVSFSQISGMVDNAFASYLGEGVISALAYSKKIIELPVLLFPYVLSIILFPYFSQLYTEGNFKKLRSLLDNSLQWVLVAFFPLSFFVGIFSTPIVKLILERGAFDHSSTQLTSLPLLIYSFGLVFFAIETIIVIYYFSVRDIKTPIFVGILCSSLNIILTYLLIEVIDYSGIPVAYVIQKVLKNIVLLLLMRKKIAFKWSVVSYFIIRVVLASIPFVMLMFAMFHWINFNTGTLDLIFKLGLTFMTGGLVYIISIKFSNLKLV